MVPVPEGEVAERLGKVVALPGAEEDPSDTAVRSAVLGEAGALAAGKAGAVSGMLAPWRLVAPWQEYLVAIAATLATFLIPLALQARLGGQATLVLFTVPILFSTHRGG